MRTGTIFTVTILQFLCHTESARILGIWPLPARSHYFLGSNLMKGLAEAGHDVTMISTFKNEEPPKRGTYNEVYLDGIYEEFERITNKVDFKKEEIFGNHISLSLRRQKFVEYFLEMEMEHPTIIDFFKSNNTFDVVIFEYFGNDALTLMLSTFDAPIIIFTSTTTSSWINDIVGNPSPLSYIPQIRGQSSLKMSIADKIYNTYIYVVDEILKFGIFLPKQERIALKYLPDAPRMDKAYTDVSLALINSHESYCQPVPMVPNMVQIGGFHVKPPKALPEDLQKFLDAANEGVVYFNLGTNIKLKDMPVTQRDAIMNAFGKLKEKVLMKWEDDVLPGKPINVEVGKWLPQNDILAHPNTKVFISHGGMLSTTEAIYHGVPILALPMFGDQFFNAKVAENLGYALTMPYRDPNFTEERMSSLLQKLLLDPKYMENAKKRSELFHDRPMTPMQTAVYWVEYVIRHKGAPHLRVSGKDLPWYEYFMLDVIGVILAGIVIFPTLLFIAVRKCLRRSRFEDKRKNKYL